MNCASAKHTPRLWEQLGTIIYRTGHDGAVICQMVEPFGRYIEAKPLELGSKGWDLQMANAQLIVTAVNSHADLLEACEAALAYDVAILGRAAKGEYDLLTEGGAITEGEDLDQLYDNWISKAKAAIAKVKAEQ